MNTTPADTDSVSRIVAQVELIKSETVLFLIFVILMTSF